MATDIHWGRFVFVCGQQMSTGVEVLLNETCFLPTSRFCFKSGELVEVTVLLENASEESPAQCALCVRPGQVCMSGDLALSPTSFAVIGSSTLHIDQIPPGTVVRHSCCFMFLNPGFYNLSILCTSLEDPQQADADATSRITGITQDGSNSSQSKLSTQRKRDQLSWVCGMPIRFEIT
ncbi:protein brunelleschi [Elysia marginata]|uniref:Protein brunelleschi n=1 Tax=Elysia marginata TaxID=1093978 RepID=A0AAV4I6U1_9GAST|nr:protein brunelleschi [Elysia marginata]